jgi:hypothetical protein
MNIYHVSWTEYGDYYLNAIVIAPNEEEALKELDLIPSYQDEICIKVIGKCIDSTAVTQVVCQESL